MAITSVIAKIYTDPQCTQLVQTAAGLPTETQRVLVTGLTEHTDYWAVAEASNDSGSTATSYPPYYFQTLWSPPVITIGHSNVTQTTATVTFTYNGNYPIDPQAMSGVIGVNGQTIQTVQFDHLSVGVPESVTLSGLTPNTLYDVSWDVEYYTDEVSAVDNFRTQAEPTGTIEVHDESVVDVSNNRMDFRCAYQMTTYGADTATFRVTVYDENRNLLADFTPTVSGSAFSGVLARAAGIELPPDCRYICYYVEVMNSHRDNLVAFVEIRPS